MWNNRQMGIFFPAYSFKFPPFYPFDISNISKYKRSLALFFFSMKTSGFKYSLTADVILKP